MTRIRSETRQAAVSTLKGRIARIEALSGIRALMEWDQMTQLPARAGPARGEQSAVVAGLLHAWLVDPELGTLLSEVDAMEGVEPSVRAGTRILLRERTRALCLPASLVEARERARARCQEAWLAARQARDFRVLEPALEEGVRLAREAGRCQAVPGESPYAALLAGYEPDLPFARVEDLLLRLGEALRPLLDAIRDRPLPAPVLPEASTEVQRALCEEVVRAVGFDLDRGRLDTSVHPFTCALHPTDVRITTRYRSGSVVGGLYAALHEAGHGLYEQGIPVDLLGTGAAHTASTGLHESQSRFWENAIGGSRAFSAWLSECLARRGHAVSAEDLFVARNRVRPGPIRVDADEVTYNLHILMRFRLESALVDGDLAVGDLPRAWDAASESLLGLRPAHPVEGVLQDVHWPEGLFGYFPTYTLGNLWAASLTRALLRDHPDLWQAVASGDFSVPLGWMRRHVHARAGLVDAPAVVAGVADAADPVEDLVAHLWARHGALHGVRRPA